MSTETLEILAQEDGSITVQRMNDAEAEPLFSLKIEDASSQFSADLKMQIAQAMAAAGMQKIAEMEHSAFYPLDEEEQSAATWH